MKSLSVLVLVVLFAHCWAGDDVRNSEVVVAKDKDVKVETKEDVVVAKRDQRIDNYPGYYGYNNYGYNGFNYGGFGFPFFGNGFPDTGFYGGYQPVPYPTYGFNGYPINGYPVGYSGYSDLNGYGSLREADKAIFNHLFGIRLLDKLQDYPALRSN